MTDWDRASRLRRRGIHLPRAVPDDADVRVIVRREVHGQRTQVFLCVRPESKKIAALACVAQETPSLEAQDALAVLVDALIEREINLSSSRDPEVPEGYSPYFMWGRRAKMRTDRLVNALVWARRLSGVHANEAASIPIKRVRR